MDLNEIIILHCRPLTLTHNVDSPLSKFNLYNKTHIRVDISGAQWCKGWQSGVHILRFIQLKWSDTSCSPPHFLPVSHLLLQWIKLCTSTTCHSVTQMRKKKKDFTSPFRWSWGGIPPSRLIFLSNPSFYVGSLLSPWSGNHILIRSILG